MQIMKSKELFFFFLQVQSICKFLKTKIGTF